MVYKYNLFFFNIYFSFTFILIINPSLPLPLLFEVGNLEGGVNITHFLC